MGRLNFNAIDAKASDVYKGVNFAGGAKSFDFRVNNLAKRKVPHTIEIKGNVAVVTSNGYHYRYKLSVEVEEIKGKTEEETAKLKKEAESEVIRIMHCCKAVRHDVKQFLKTNEPYSFGKSETVFVSQAATGFFIHSGGREVDLVDIKCCYWTVLRNFGIISAKTFEAYKEYRDPRLIAVGCLKRAKHTKFHDGDKVVNTQVERSDVEWVWDFVVYKTYQAIKTVCDAVGWRVFSYITDGIYLPSELSSEAVSILEKLGFQVSVKKYKIVGYQSHYMVLENASGFYKRANLGMSTGIKSALREIPKEEFEAKNNVADVDNAFKTGNESAVAEAERTFDRFNSYC